MDAGRLFERQRAVEHHVERAAGAQIDFLAAREQSGREADRSAGGRADASAAPASGRHAADSGSRSGKNGDATGVLKFGRRLPSTLCPVSPDSTDAKCGAILKAWPLANVSVSRCRAISARPLTRPLRLDSATVPCT